MSEINERQNGGQGIDPAAEEKRLRMEIQLQRERAQAEFQLTAGGQELAVINARREAEFALTPMGQQVKQMEITQRVAQMYNRSTLVPTAYQGEAGFSNCCIAVDMATRMQANPLMVMQNLYIVHGNPSWSSKFLIATINTCGRFMPLQYECNGLQGDDYGWRCVTYAENDIATQNRLEGPWVTWRMVKAEGWDVKQGSKWRTMPEVMFRYRAAAFWQRLYAPEIGMGFQTVEESQDLRDVQDVEYEEIVERTRARNSEREEREERARTDVQEMARRNALNEASAPQPPEGGEGIAASQQMPEDEKAFRGKMKEMGFTADKIDQAWESRQRSQAAGMNANQKQMRYGNS